MSRSTKKAIYKDKGYMKGSYWRIYRRVTKQTIYDHAKYFLTDFLIEDIEPNIISPKQLINDYDYSDYRIDYQYGRKKGYYFFVTNSFQYKEKQKEMEEYASKLKRK